MISYFRGPGGFGRRAAAEFVPFWASVMVGLTAIAFVPPVVLVVVWLATWFAASALLRWVRTKDRLRRIYRIALGLHIAFWSLLGILHSYPQEPGALGTPTVHDWGRATTVRIGAASATFQLPERATLAGWGQAPRRIRIPPWGGFGVIGRLGLDYMGGLDADGAPRLPVFRRADNVATHDVGARAMVILPEELEEAAPVAFLSLDLVTVEGALTTAIVERLAPLGFRPETVTVSATHTHSGPGGTSRQPLSEIVGTDHFDPEVFEAVVSAAVDSVKAAVDGSIEGRIWYGVGRDRDPETGAPRIARNRRKADTDDIDDRIHVLRLATRMWHIRGPERDVGAGGLLLNYAVHPILNRRRSTSFSKDLAGDIEVAFAMPHDPWEVLFVNGAAADVSPRHATGNGEGRGPALAKALRASVMGKWDSQWPPLVRVRAARVTRDFGTPYAVWGVGDRPALTQAAKDGLFSGGVGGVVADALLLPVNALLWSSGVTEARLAVRFSGAAGVIANLELAVTENEHAFGAIVLELGKRGEERSTEVPILWAPAEATQALGKHWRRTIADGFFFGYTNGVMAYVTTDAEYDVESYESRTTLYGRRTGTMVGEALKAAYDAALSSGADR
ncbi:MAG: neutral/alkaline non-lysosomal ceramidase N-terminal domain-containing protein [Planctomycetota bacterium]|nr:neutral/alkaline non-lysosomal ceramidase N-terminal domain-containing protein [Planctomycetota bacterium]